MNLSIWFKDRISLVTPARMKCISSFSLAFGLWFGLILKAFSELRMSLEEGRWLTANYLNRVTLRHSLMSAPINKLVGGEPGFEQCIVGRIIRNGYPLTELIEMVCAHTHVHACITEYYYAN